MSHMHRPLALIILDGWGYSEEAKHNAIMAANTPVWDHLWNDYPHTLINASGAGVGLPGEQMGNSEVGHLNIGAGRVVYQEFTRISRAIRTGSFFTNQTLTDVVDDVFRNDKALHILGLLSDGGVHSHESHIQAMVKLAAERGANKIYLHAFLDGRDTSPKSAQKFIENMHASFNASGKGRFASIIGRYYAMDRDKRWDRVQQAYDLITNAQANYQADNAINALEQAYARGESDEFVKATLIGEKAPIEDGDAIVFMNFRADRARELTQTFIEPEFNEFPKQRSPRLSQFVTLTEYKKDFNVPVAFPPEKLNNLLGECISAVGLRQLRIAETEKYAHVTFFFNGGRDAPYEGEDRILVPSPKVDTYDLQPEMNAPEVAERLVKAIHSNQYDVIICNFANADMVGHTGNFNATVKAIEALDNCLGKIWSALKESGGEMLVTADHGNAEKMLDDEKGQAHTAHTSNLVPFIYAGRPATCAEQGGLSDIAPTMLHLIGQPIPPEMNNHLLVKLP
ncbi:MULTISPECIES: 2,3-bisphosphoglycerate-independent phosphoglycerate mutase [unclassified Methylophaga]|uniref:2,3-bisphosphoglycerate-independent phosphoglycerate mutase n=1 Tax=unclassified Methylophaga TaxID=2629249 RepID=UPI000C8AB696|nr:MULTISPECIES: 2,3-bisphosphoglycerate-independent phosphoglycerate mutase [unclassified Methylophaga]MBN45641.1 phosphoglycerate mutase (2,3-diphosphoglycerate-independent) [Methylophaga sp.]|tara:strand:- start:13327 stop:14859 length:1533 start_codon:yes stop_codon:yes gene_type:complete